MIVVPFPLHIYTWGRRSSDLRLFAFAGRLQVLRRARGTVHYQHNSRILLGA